MIDSNPYYCSNIVNGLYIEKISSGQLRVGACCLNKLSDPRDHIDFYNDPYLQNQRSLMWNQQPVPGCSQCYISEKENNHSLRIASNSRQPRLDWSTVELQSLDYNVDPICNAKCIQCSSYYSSAWLAEDQRFQSNTLMPVRTTSDTRHNNTIDSLDLTSLKKIYFNGGEPMLSADFQNILEKLDQTNQLSNIVLQFNTNGSIMPSERLIQLWSKCSQITVIFSIDGVDDAFEYIRNPLKWDHVQSVIKQFGKLNFAKFSIQIGFTAGIHNVDIIEHTYQWYKQISQNWNFFHDFSVHPCHGVLDIANASAALKNVWLTQLEQLPPRKWHNFLRSRFSSTQNSDRWIKWLETIDHRRNLNWKNSLPLLAQSLENSLA